MILHWLSTAWRSLVANPLFSLITIASLSIGCCGALLAGANIKQHLSFESGFADADRILLLRARYDGKPGTFLARGNPPVREGEFSYNVHIAMKNAIEGKVPGMVAQTRVLSGGSVLVDERGETKRISTRTVDTSFFDVFEHVFIEGNRATGFATPNSIVLTRSGAKELFGDQPALGKELRGIGGHTMRVGAIIEDPPQPTMFDYKVLASTATRGMLDPEFAAEPWGWSSSGGHYIRIAKDTDRDAFIPTANHVIDAIFREGLAIMIAGQADQAKKMNISFGINDMASRVSLLPLTELHFAPREATRGYIPAADITMLTTLATGAGALLAVSAFNYIILSLARSLRRRREVGVRKALGASGGALTRQYLAEAGLITAISLALGFGLAEIIQPWFARALNQPEILFNLYDPVFLVVSLAGFLLLALFVGAYPALYLAWVRPRAGLDSSNDEGGRGVGRLLTRGLLGLEIAAASVLLVIALTMAAQAQYVAARPLGFNLANLYAINSNCGVNGTNEYAASNPRCSEALERAVRETPGIKQVAYAANPSIISSSQLMPIVRPGQTAELGSGTYEQVDAGFLPLTGAKLLAGRFFDANSAYDRRILDAYPTYPAEPFDSAPVVVTRAILPMLGAATPDDAIGQRIMIGEDRWAKSYEIVGVIEDWHQRSLKYQVAPIVFVPGGTFMNVIAEIDTANLDNVTRRLTPPEGFVNGGLFVRLTVTPLETAFENAYTADRQLMHAVMGFAGVAMLVACLGVYGLSAFDMRRRVREIGIRKALGATPAKVAGMVLGQQVLFASIASVLSWPIAYWLSNAWLQQYVYRTSLGPAVLPVASAIVVGFVALAVGLNTARAAAIRPSFALRTAT